MSNDMTRQEFTEYMESLERRLETRFDRIETRLDTVDARFDDVDQRFTSIDQRFTSIDRRFSDIDRRFSDIDRRFDAVDTRFDTLEQSMKVQFEEVRRDLRFSLEALTALRETTDRGFEQVRADHAGQTTLLEDALRHVRRRVETVENRRRAPGGKPRRR